MASKEKLAQWLFDNRKQLQLKALVGKWVKDWLPSFDDIRVQLKINGRSYEGRGISTDQDRAFLVAGAEAIERAYCDSLGINSSGVALHTTEEKAKLNAKLELLERDGFLCHFLTKTPFINFNVPQNIDIDFDRIRARLKKKGVEISLKKVVYSSPQIVLCIARKIKGPNLFHCILGLGSNENIKVSTTKAIAECLSNVVWMLEGYKENIISHEEFKNKMNCHSIDHQQVYLRNGNELSLDWIFDGQDSTMTIDMGARIEFSTLKSDISILDNAPVTVVRATSTELQNIFYGLTTLEKINMDRLKQFTGSNVDETNINWMPHPIG